MIIAKIIELEGEAQISKVYKAYWYRIYNIHRAGIFSIYPNKGEGEGGYLVATDSFKREFKILNIFFTKEKIYTAFYIGYW